MNGELPGARHGLTTPVSCALVVLISIGLPIAFLAGCGGAPNHPETTRAFLEVMIKEIGLAEEQAGQYLFADDMSEIAVWSAQREAFEILWPSLAQEQGLIPERMSTETYEAVRSYLQKVEDVNEIQIEEIRSTSSPPRTKVRIPGQEYWLRITFTQGPAAVTRTGPYRFVSRIQIWHDRRW